VIQTDSEHEWWASRASLLVTDLQGNHLDLPPDVRAYMIAGAPHFAEPGERMKGAPAMALPVNPMHAGMPMRALLTAMQAWITTGAEPPASRVPMLAHGTLVDAADAVPRGIPGLPYTGIYTGAGYTDPQVFPPKLLGMYPVFVPRATYTGWNPRSQGYGAGTLFPLQGAVVPFAATRAEREAAKDPRPSLAERYADNAAYVAAVRAAAARMVAERLLLPQDAERAVELAAQDRLSQLR
jgi:hypothetical protein